MALGGSLTTFIQISLQGHRAGASRNCFLSIPLLQGTAGQGWLLVVGGRLGIPYKCLEADMTDGSAR